MNSTLSDFARKARSGEALTVVFFGGFFWRDTGTGQVYVQLGGPSCRIMKVDHLDTCEKCVVDLDIAASDVPSEARLNVKEWGPCNLTSDGTQEYWNAGMLE